MEPQIDAITLGVKDVQRAKEFYVHGLGCEPVQEAEGFVALSLGAAMSTLGLYAWDALAADAGVAPEGSGFRATAMSFIVDAADGVDALTATVRRAGGTVVKQPHSQFWGGYTGYVADPDGHLWKIGANHRPSTFRSRGATTEHVTPPTPCETAVTLACRDVKQSKTFYADGLGFTVDKSYGKFVSFRSDGGALFSLYAWDALADDAGVAPTGTGFRGITLSRLVPSADHVDEVLRAAGEAGGTVAPAARAPWGGYAGHFRDPSGHVWKVAARQ